MLDALILEQRRLGLSDRAFGLSLGVPGRTWNAARRGHRSLSAQIVREAIKVYPHLMQTGVFFLLSGDTTSKESQTIRNKPPSNIDAEASERTRTLVLTNDRRTLACRATETAPTGQGRGGSRDQGVPQPTRQGYVNQIIGTSDLASRAVVGEAG